MLVKIADLLGGYKADDPMLKDRAITDATVELTARSRYGAIDRDLALGLAATLALARSGINPGEPRGASLKRCGFHRSCASVWRAAPSRSRAINVR